MKLPAPFTALFLCPLLLTAEPDAALLKKAQGGDAAAMFELGEALSVEEPEQSREWVQKAADKGYAPAEVQLFHLIAGSSPGEVAPPDATKYLRRAIDRGYAPAMKALAGWLSDLHLDGEKFRSPTTEEMVEAAALWRRAADLGDAGAASLYGFAMVSGESLKPDVPTAIPYLERAAAAGDGDALRYLTGLFTEGKDYFGNAYHVDWKKAIYWQEKESFAEGADKYQLIPLARLYLKQPSPTAADRAKARQLVEQVLDDGGSINEEMRTLLGVAVATEPAPAWARAEPFATLRRRARVFDREAQLELFDRVTKELSANEAAVTEAYAYLLDAAKHRHRPAPYRVGAYLANDHTVGEKFIPGDLRAAAPWYRQGAEWQHGEAMYEWALLLAVGEVVPKDFSTALQVMRKAAADERSVGAQQYLSDLYRHGSDHAGNRVTVDLAEAARWQKLLVQGGDASAYASYGGLLLELPNPDLAELRTLVPLLEKRLAAGHQEAQGVLDALRKKFPALVPAPVAAAPVSVASSASAVAAAEVPMANKDRELALQALDAQYGIFEKQFNAATTAGGREKALERLGQWIQWKRPAGLSAAEAGEWVLKKITPLLLRDSREAVGLLTSVSDSVFPKEMTARVLPESLKAAIQTEAQRVVDNYYADQKKNTEIAALKDKANAGDGRAALAIGLLYLSMSDGLEKQWANAIYWLTKSHELKTPGAYEPLRKLTDQVNARVKSAGAARDAERLIEIHSQKAYSALSDASESAILAALMLLDEGDGLAEDIPRADALLQRAIDAGSAEAMLTRGFIYILHEAQPIDEARAVEWFRKAAAAGSDSAKLWLEVLSPPATPPERAKLAYQMATKRTYGKENTIDFAAGAGYTRYAARLGHAEALALRGTSYLMSDTAKATEFYLKAANAGSVNAMNALASGTEDKARARSWRLKAAAAGGLYEKNQAGVALMRGDGGPIDLAGARTWFLQAAESGSFEAMYHLGELWFDRKLRAGTEAEAVQWWKKAAEAKIREAQYRLGLLYRDGAGGLAKDPAEARRWLELAAARPYEPAKKALGELGDGAAKPDARTATAQTATTVEQDRAGALKMDGEAMYRMGERYETGDGVASDLTVALAWYRKAAAMGLPRGRDAVKDLETMAASKRGVVETAAEKSATQPPVDGAAPAATTGAGGEAKPAASADGALGAARTFAGLGLREDAGKMFLRAAEIAETGTPATQYFLSGVLFRGDLGVPRDQARALRLLESAANAEHPAAQVEWGQVVSSGSHGVKADPAKGQSYFVKVVALAEGHNAEGLMIAANLLMSGAPGVPSDRVRSLRLLKEAVDRNFAVAQFEYGRALIQGLPELPRDHAAGTAMIRKAAEQKLPQAAYSLGEAYEKGIGVAADLELAEKWYKEAVASFPEAQAAVNRVVAARNAKPTK